MSPPAKDPQIESPSTEVEPLPFFHAHRRLVLCGLLFAALAGALWRVGLTPSRAGLLAFDVAALVFLLLTAAAFGKATPAMMRVRAQQVDVGRGAVLWGSVALSCLVMAALWTEMRAAGGAEGVADLVAAAISIVLSWLYMNMIFALHYAHGYYSHRNAMHKGLDFPGKEDPDYWDFAYFALVLGMTFQVSDVQIVSRRMRRTALVPRVTRVFFNLLLSAITAHPHAGPA
ncbi:DUF1345 domain-containing protein [Achromobacter ruhlandii]|uniref:DUF1345 domain-containing protein n=1 Tax=Achromobacter ruhlandii TaxID=72557 RepID=A0A848NPQ8_9BURK|nr:DUF1345 domain-containing protein [Achromobacter ruhlandii]NMU93306.1 DUF1345 domain-containing protein [Achromobacter ruhlandii]